MSQIQLYWKWEGSGVRGGELKAGYTIHWNGKAAIVFSLKCTRQPQCTSHAEPEMVIGNNLITDVVY